MTTEHTNNNLSDDNKSEKVFIVDKYVCNYIATEWMEEGQSSRSFAMKHGIHESIARKIRKDNGYNIPVATLTTICFYKGIKTSDFFRALEEKYGDKINDDYIEKTNV